MSYVPEKTIYLCLAHMSEEGVEQADVDGIAKVTEINIRYVAYNCLLANAGFNLAECHLTTALGQSNELTPELEIQFPKNNMWLRDVDALPIYIENPKKLSIG